MTVVLTSPVVGQQPGTTYTGVLEPWLLVNGYARAQSSPVDHTKDTAVLPKDDPTLAINREDPHQPYKLSGGLASPEVSAIAPATGGTAGLNTVTLTGDNLSDVTGVTFGGTAGTEIKVVDDSHITVKVPAHAAGAVNVVITDPDGSLTKTAFYTYA